MLGFVMMVCVACAPQDGSQLAPPAEGPPELGRVLTLVKRELAIFARDAQANPLEVGTACGSRQPLTLEIRNVSVEIATTVRNAGSGTAGVVVPIGATPVTVGPSLNAGITRTNSQVITLNFRPEGRVNAIPNEEGPHELADALIGLRRQIAAIGGDGQCIRLANEPAAKNTLELAFTVETVTGGGVKLSLAMLTLGVSGERRRTGANTITVTYGFGSGAGPLRGGGGPVR